MISSLVSHIKGILREFCIVKVYSLHRRKLTLAVTLAQNIRDPEAKHRYHDATKHMDHLKPRSQPAVLPLYSVSTEKNAKELTGPAVLAKF